MEKQPVSDDTELAKDSDLLDNSVEESSSASGTEVSMHQADSLTYSFTEDIPSCIFVITKYSFHISDCYQRNLKSY